MSALPDTQARNHTLHVSGMHCAACVHLIGDILRDVDGVASAQVNLQRETVEVNVVTDENAEALCARLNPHLAKDGYTLHETRPANADTTKDWLLAVPIALLVVLGFLGLERAGVTSLIGGREASLVTALLVGLVASVSTCLAVVGGLVLSVSARYAQSGQGWKPQALFHAGRMAGFFVLGALLGLVGSAVRISITGSVLLGAVASVIMLMLGIQLLDVTKRIRVLTVPSLVSSRMRAVAERTCSVAPVLLGVVTFFLPCGFTQSMQVVALSSGNMLDAALMMSAFAAGTFPVLALLSFGSLDLAKSRYRGAFFKVAGLVVILFALYNLQNVLAVFGIIRPLITL